MTRSSTSQEYNKRSDILGFSQLAIWCLCSHCLDTSLHFYETICHLRRVKARCNSVSKYMPWSKSDGKVLCQVYGGGFRCRIAKSGIVTHGTYANPSNGGRDYHTRSRFDGCRLFQQWRKSVVRMLVFSLFPLGNVDALLHSVKDTLNIQIHHLLEGVLRVCIELLTPGSSGIGKEDINMVCCLADLCH